jgi:hypothetical protein
MTRRIDSAGRIPRFIFFLFLTASFLALSPACASLTLPTEFKAIDKPYDDGSSILLIWSNSPNDSPKVDYIVYASTATVAQFEPRMRMLSHRHHLTDSPSLFGFAATNKDYHYAEIELPVDKKGHPIQEFFKLGMTDGVETVVLDKIVTAIPKVDYFSWNKINNFIILLVMFVAVYYFVNRAKRNPNIFLRKIPGLEAVDEAVGRATEMGKPLLYLTGSYDMDSISTIASVNILAHIAKKVAQYDSRLIVPCRQPVAMTVCQEVVREAYINAGRPDAYNANDIFLIAAQQFSFVAAVDGLMMREKPAANFFLGTFGGEALLLAETGAMSGAIQISGTDSTYQIPFFIAACDYCLIGEELYAASAYLSREPKLLGSLRGQDTGKILLTVAIALGALFITIYQVAPLAWLESILHFLSVR